MGKITIDIVSLVNLFGVVYAVLFSLIVLKYKMGQKTTQRILAGLMLSLGVIIMASFLITSEAYYYYPHLFKMAPLFYLLVGPLLYFYIKSLTEKGFHFRPFHILHLAPFVLNAAAYLPFYLSPGEAKLTAVDSFLASLGYHIELFAFLIFRLIHLLVYLVLCLRLISGHGRKLREVFSYHRKNQLVWMKTLIWAFGTVFLAYCLFFIFRILGGEFWFTASRWLSIWETLLVVYLSYKGLTQPDIFKFNGAGGSLRTPLPAEEAAEHLETLQSYMKNDKPYLKSDLTIKDLAAAISLPYWRISQVINERLRQNFFEFVNHYRVEEAKRMIDHGDKNMLEIAYDVGFNSKSAFNASFKKIVQQTPSQYKIGRNKY